MRRAERHRVNDQRARAENGEKGSEKKLKIKNRGVFFELQIERFPSILESRKKPVLAVLPRFSRRCRHVVAIQRRRGAAHTPRNIRCQTLARRVHAGYSPAQPFAAYLAELSQSGNRQAGPQSQPASFAKYSAE